MRTPLVIYDFATAPFFIYEEILIFFFISAEVQITFNFIDILKAFIYNIFLRPLFNSVPNPYVFGPLGSRSVIICTDPDPDPSINKQKVWDKPWFLLYVNSQWHVVIFED